jgi:1-acyl-sn-glycerol-3-phosphate acyltransferase
VFKYNKKYYKNPITVITVDKKYLILFEKNILIIANHQSKDR